MKREFLQEFRVGEEGLPKEVIDAIMAENGRDIQKVKANFADYEELKTRLEQLQQDTSYAQAAADWEEKYNRAVEDHKNQLARMAFEKTLEQSILEARGRNPKAIAALLDMETLKESENQEEAIKAALEEVKRDNRYLFLDQAPPPYARGTGALTGVRETHPTTLAGALREKFERK